MIFTLEILFDVTDDKQQGWNDNATIFLINEWISPIFTSFERARFKVNKKILAKIIINHNTNLKNPMLLYPLK